MFDFTLSEEQRALQTLVREFVEREVKPRVAALDAEPDPAKGVPWEIIRAANQVGLRNLAMRKDLGGGETDCVTLGMCVEELGVGDLGVSVVFAQNWKITQMLQYKATEEQIRKFLIPLREDPVGLMAVGYTEPESGSDFIVPCLDPKGGMKLSSVGDGNYAVLNGTKQFISNGFIAHLYIISTRSNKEVPFTQGMTTFIVPRDLPGVPNLPGFTIGRVYDKIGERLAGNAELIFENCRVPLANMLGEWHKAYEQVVPGFRMSNAYAAGPARWGWAGRPLRRPWSMPKSGFREPGPLSSMPMSPSSWRTCTRTSKRPSSWCGKGAGRLTIWSPTIPCSPARSSLSAPKLL